MKIYIPFFLILLLGGCAQGIEGISGRIQSDSKFNEIVLKDVQQAKLLAERANDPLALKCWSYIEEFALANAPNTEIPAGKVVGVFSAYQKARNIRRLVVEVRISDEFRLSCGPMLTETMGVLGRLGIRIAL